MELRKFPSGPFATNTYIVVCPETNQAAIIDAPPESFKPTAGYLARTEAKPAKILLTHSHWDHIADAAALKQHYMIPLYVHPLDAPNLISPGADGLPSTFSIEPIQPDGFFDEGDIIEVGSLRFEVIHTPGHTPGGVCFWCEKEGALFSGDTLFRSTIGNLSFPTCEPEKMWVSLKKLSQLPPETKVYPGHGPPTTIGNEPWLINAKHYFGEML